MKDCLKLGEIHQFAMTTTDIDKVIRYEECADFDFKNFKPISGAVNKDDYYKVGYNDSNQIVEINHYEQHLRLTNFRMPVFHKDSFLIFGYEGFANDYNRDNEGEFINGYFVHVKRTKKNYFINCGTQFGQIPEAGNLIIGSIGKGGFGEISSIMLMNDEFFPTHLIRISSGVIVIGSEMVYSDENQNKLSYEKLYFFNIPEFEFNLDINEQTCINEVWSLFDKVSGFTVPAKPYINEKYLHVPLWTEAGAHPYIQDY